MRSLHDSVGVCVCKCALGTQIKCNVQLWFAVVCVLEAPGLEAIIIIIIIITRHAPRLQSFALAPCWGVEFLAPNAGASSQLLLQLGPSLGQETTTITEVVDSNDNKALNKVGGGEGGIVRLVFFPADGVNEMN